MTSPDSIEVFEGRKASEIVQGNLAANKQIEPVRISSFALIGVITGAYMGFKPILPEVESQLSEASQITAAPTASEILP